MGSGRWDLSAYRSTTGHSVNNVGAAATFAYSTTTRSTLPRDEWKAHDELDPLQAIAGPGSDLAGQQVRESRDIDGAESLAVAVLFDVTGSMRQVPIELVTKLPALFGLLQMKGYVEHPQLMIGGIGDATCDQVPLQASQFEADNKLDDALTKLFLEGGGGGQLTESYELAAYWMARHTATDCWEKRQHKGYLFIIGDEMAYGQVKANEVRKHIGDDLAENISTKAIFDELAEKWDVTFIIPKGTSYYDRPDVLEHWQQLVGPQQVIKLPDLAAVAETIAVRVGVAEEAIDLAKGLDDLRELATDETTIDSVNAALATA